MKGSTPDSVEAKDQARRAGRMAQENPLGIAIGGVAVGLLAGLAVPVTKAEEQRLGPVAGNVVGQAKAAGQEAIDHGREVVTHAAGVAADTLREEAPEHGRRVAESAKEGAGQD